MPNSTRALTLSTDQQEQLQQWLAAHGTPQQVALRCRMVLAAAQGRSDLAIASALQVNRHSVKLWRKRFAEQGLRSAWEIAPGRGRKPTYGAEKVKAVVDATLQTKPKGMTHWSCRLMAKSQGLSKSTVSKIWRSHNLKPHRVKTLKLRRGRSPSLAEEASAFRAAFRAHQFQLAELGRALVWRAHPQAHPPRLVPQRARLDRRDRRIPGGLE